MDTNTDSTYINITKIYNIGSAKCFSHVSGWSSLVPRMDNYIQSVAIHNHALADLATCSLALAYNMSDTTPWIRHGLLQCFQLISNRFSV